MVKYEKKVAVLYAMNDSIYKQYCECDVYDENRDARSFPGGLPVIAHPPCRLWSKMRHFSTAPESEKLLAFHAVEQVRKNGGVLEHPSSSTLFDCMNLPHQSNGYDDYGGFTLGIHQYCFGHKARKPTKLYIVGIKKRQLPQIPIKMGDPEYVVASSKRKHSKPLKKLTRKGRIATPKIFAEWLIELAKLTRQNNS